MRLIFLAALASFPAAMSCSNASPEAGALDASLESAIDGSIDAPVCRLKEPYSTKDLDCNACAETHCCEVINACLTEPDCNDGYVLCAIACAIEQRDSGMDAADADAGDPTKVCKDGCKKQYPKGEPLYQAFSACTDEQCGLPCR